MARRLLLLSLLLGCPWPASVDAGPDTTADVAALRDTPLRDAPFPDGIAPADPSVGCGRVGRYPTGNTAASLVQDGRSRTFTVHVPPGYDGPLALPVVLLFHGGGGSADQLQNRSAGMDPIADREGFVAVYPDGTGALRTWNAGGCCGAAVRDAVDDVGFVGALLDELEAELCVDRRRVYASGMSNGGMMSHRLGCELADRIAAIAPVAAVDVTATCAPSRPVPIFHVHGSSDGHVPWEGGVGCGPSGVDYPSVPDSIEGWRSRNGCETTTTPGFSEGDGRCDGYDGCDADTVLCTIEGGGHSWPGGAPGAGAIDCPADGPQSTTFFASEAIWSFFADHPR